MAETNPYRLADLTLTLLIRQATRRANAAKHKLTTLGFDELNVIKEIESLYEWLDRNNRMKYAELFMARYREMHGKRKGDALEELMEMELANLLSEPNEVTHYTYAEEVLRKRDRAEEAIFSVPTRAQKQLEIDKAVRIFMQQTRFYTDLTFDRASYMALKGNGVERVRWHTQRDGKVCGDCDERDGVVYPINQVPPKPHPNCRCIIVPA